MDQYKLKNYIVNAEVTGQDVIVTVDDKVITLSANVFEVLFEQTEKTLTQENYIKDLEEFHQNSLDTTEEWPEYQ